MKYLIISTLQKDDRLAQEVIKELLQEVNVSEVIYADTLKINGCIGCNDCWLKTPGICCVKDDYEQILIKYLQVERVIFITEAKFGFISYKMKNMIDRILPLATMYLKFENGQMRHYSRYKKKTDMGILYTGEGDSTYLNLWMERAMLNINWKSLGVYSMDKRKEFYYALNSY